MADYSDSLAAALGKAGVEEAGASMEVGAAIDPSDASYGEAPVTLLKTTDVSDPTKYLSGDAASTGTHAVEASDGSEKVVTAFDVLPKDVELGEAQATADAALIFVIDAAEDMQAQAMRWQPVGMGASDNIVIEVATSQNQETGEVSWQEAPIWTIGSDGQMGAGATGGGLEAMFHDHAHDFSGGMADEFMATFEGGEESAFTVENEHGDFVLDDGLMTAGWVDAGIKTETVVLKPALDVAHVFGGESLKWDEGEATEIAKPVKVMRIRAADTLTEPFMLLSEPEFITSDSFTDPSGDTFFFDDSKAPLLPPQIEMISSLAVANFNLSENISISRAGSLFENDGDNLTLFYRAQPNSGKKLILDLQLAAIGGGSTDPLLTATVCVVGQGDDVISGNLDEFTATWTDPGIPQNENMMASFDLFLPRFREGDMVFIKITATSVGGANLGLLGYEALVSGFKA
jgi:hypothetical protein